MQLREARRSTYRGVIALPALALVLLRPGAAHAEADRWMGPSVELGVLRTLGSTGGEHGNTFEGGTGLGLRVGFSFLAQVEGGVSYEYRRVSTTNRVGSSTAPVTLSAHLLDLGLGFQVVPHVAVHLAGLLGAGYVGQASYHDTQLGIVLGGAGGLRFYLPVGEHLLMLTTEVSMFLMSPSGGSPGIGDFGVPAVSALLGFVW